MIRLFGVCLVILVAAGCTNVTVTTPQASGLCRGRGWRHSRAGRIPSRRAHRGLGRRRDALEMSDGYSAVKLHGNTASEDDHD
jgi:hypothetical protein